MRRKMSLFGAILVLIVSVYLLGGCTSSEDAVSVRVNEVTHSVFYAPFYVAMEEGYFAEEGIEIELTTGGGSDNSMTALLTDAADFALLGPETAVYVLNEGKEDHAVIISQLTRKDGSFLLAKEPMEDFRWSDVRGSSIIGGRTGGMPEMMLEYVLKQEGMIPNEDVTVRTDVDFDLMGGAFIAGEDDYVTLFEPSASTMEQGKQGYIVASVGEAAGDVPYTCFMTLKSTLGEDPALVEAFVRAVYRGQQFVAEQDAAAIAEAIKGVFPDSDTELITAVVQNYKDIDVWTTEPMLKEEDYLHLIDIIKDAGIIETAPDFDLICSNHIGEQVVE